MVLYQVQGGHHEPIIGYKDCPASYNWNEQVLMTLYQAQDSQNGPYVIHKTGTMGLARLMIAILVFILGI